MSSNVFRFTTLHHNVDRAIRTELVKQAPDALRLFRLRRLRQSIKDHLARRFRPMLRAVQAR
jgi:hypothetical protein